MGSLRSKLKQNVEESSLDHQTWRYDIPHCGIILLLVEDPYTRHMGARHSYACSDMPEFLSHNHSLAAPEPQARGLPTPALLSRGDGLGDEVHLVKGERAQPMLSTCCLLKPWAFGICSMGPCSSICRPCMQYC